MTTSTKLTLGFSILIMMFIIIEVAVLVPMESIDEQVRTMSDVSRPRLSATKAIEVGILSFALAGRTYIQSGDSSHKNLADDAIVEIEFQHSEYLRLAETDRQRQLAGELLSRWQRFKEKGLVFLNEGKRVYSADELSSIAASRSEVLAFLRDVMLTEAETSYNEGRGIALERISVLQRFAVILFILSIIGAVAVSQTVSRTVLRGEAETHRRRELLRATLTSIADAVVTIDTEGCITLLNFAAENLTGSTQAEAVGKHLGTVVKFIDKTTGDEAESPALLALRDGKHVSSDSVMLATQYGTKIPIEDHAAPILNPKGEVVGSVLVFRDVTERIIHEQQMIKIQEELELRVSNRTFELAETHAELVKEMDGRAAAEQPRIDLLGRIVSGQEDERRRIARDLHDQLGQRLTAMRLKIASLKDAAREDEILTPKIDGLQEIALSLDSEVSYLAWELRPSALDDLGFEAALDAYVLEWSRHFEIPADFQSAKIPKRRLNEQIEIHMYRIAQEALNNIAKHADAKQVSVVLERLDERMVLIIEDDGIGFVPKKIAVPEKSGRGLGLLGMRERATLIGGEVEIESAPGSGTTIFVRVPLAPPSTRKIV